MRIFFLFWAFLHKLTRAVFELITVLLKFDNFTWSDYHQTFRTQVRDFKVLQKHFCPCVFWLRGLSSFLLPVTFPIDVRMTTAYNSFYVFNNNLLGKCCLRSKRTAIKIYKVYSWQINKLLLVLQPRIDLLIFEMNKYILQYNSNSFILS